MKPIRVALLGFGVVGSGTWKVLTRNQSEIVRRAGRSIEIVAIADLDVDKVRAATEGSIEVSGDAMATVTRPDIDVVIELIPFYIVAVGLLLGFAYLPWLTLH